jgi:nucleotide-binding universal stress UspA family protein
MFNRIIVPIDGSDESWRALPVGDRMASACGAELEVVRVVPSEADVTARERSLRRQVTGVGLVTLAPHVHAVEAEGKSVAAVLAERLAATNGSVLVMASSGRGRSGAVLGSVATDVLRTTFGPVVVVGPAVGRDARFRGKDIVVAVDGSRYSEASLGLAAAWSIGFAGRLWITTTVERSAMAPSDTFESNYVSRLADDVAKRAHREVEFEVLHGGSPARAVSEFAERVGAGMIVAATHGRTGLARLALGSTSASLVRHATCPVVLLRPPELALAVGDLAATPHVVTG